MAWDFSTEPEFQAQLDWMRDFVRAEVWPIETVFDDCRDLPHHDQTNQVFEGDTT